MKLILAFAFLLCLSILAIAQDPVSEPPPLDDGEVVKISTTLVQLDAIVTDKDGNQVTNLTADDFELFENGKPQKITHFSYVGLDAKQPPKETPQAGRKNSKSTVVIPTSNASASQIRRTYAIVVDDLGIAAEHIPAIKDAIKKFINEQMQDGDFVAIVRTGGGNGALQTFTTDKRQLLAAADKIRWNAFGSGGINTFEPIRTTLKEDLENTVSSDGSSSSPIGIEEENKFEASANDYRRSVFEAGTLGALSYIISGMSELPGKKSVVLYTQGFSAITSVDANIVLNDTFAKLRSIAELANRSSVVFYTIDPRGLVDPSMISAVDDVRTVVPTSGGSPLSTSKIEARVGSFRDSLQTIRFLAYETGGVPFVNNNNMFKGLERAVNDLSGYYLIGYEPSEESFDKEKAKYNSIEIKTKSDGLKVRTRNGFYGIPDSSNKAVEASSSTKVYRALTSSLSASEIDVSVNSLFAASELGEKVIQAFIHIDANAITFEKQSDGTYLANIDIIAKAFSDKVSGPKEFSQNYSVRLDEENKQRAISRGFVFRITTPIEDDGAYQFRVAVHDQTSKRVGSASQFVSVPKISKGKIALSGVLVNRYTAIEWKNLLAGTGRPKNEVETDINNAVRMFHPGDILQYGFFIYNSKSGASLTVRTRLVKDGAVISEGDRKPIGEAGKDKLRTIENYGAISIGKLRAGNYILQVIVEDSKNGKPVGTQWVEFEIG